MKTKYVLNDLAKGRCLVCGSKLSPKEIENECICTKHQDTHRAYAELDKMYSALDALNEEF